MKNNTEKGQSKSNGTSPSPSQSQLQPIAMGQGIARRLYSECSSSSTSSPSLSLLGIVHFASEGSNTPDAFSQAQAFDTIASSFTPSSSSQMQVQWKSPAAWDLMFDAQNETDTFS